MNNLKFVPLGGMGNVTQNMYLYIYGDEILIVDCGIGFPDLYMPGVDVLIPDISYLLKQLEEGKRIVGMILTHGHDDHIGATPYLLPQLPAFPIYASPLTAGFVKNRVSESAARDWEIITTETGHKYTAGTHFQFEAVKVTHSVPDTRHYAITTPEGVIYHGSDFKLDPNPVDGETSDLERMSQLGKEGILCALIDCLRVERDTWTKSESMVGPTILEAMTGTEGKFIITLMSSHIHRIQQTITAAASLKRKVVFIGRSVEQNVQAAMELGKLQVPFDMIVDKKMINDYADEKLCIIIAGSQGQEGSSLVRAIYGEHPVIQIKQRDKVVFSADAIPGNQVQYYQSIDELCRNNVDVLYPDIVENLHQSGHASAPEQMELVSLLKPKYLLPVGGADRHRTMFVKIVAQPLGFNSKEVLLPKHGEILAFSGGNASVDEKINIQATTVDGLGIGDVGPIVLSDRQALSQAGVIVLIIPRQGKIGYNLANMQVVSRGFVFMKEADEVIQFIKDTTADAVHELKLKKGGNDALVRTTIEKKLGRKLHQVIQRSPMILTVFV
jgi:ribonuclease J